MVFVDEIHEHGDRALWEAVMTRKQAAERGPEQCERELPVASEVLVDGHVAVNGFYGNARFTSHALADADNKENITSLSLDIGDGEDGLSVSAFLTAEEARALVNQMLETLEWLEER